MEKINNNSALDWWQRFALDDGKNKRLLSFGFKNPLEDRIKKEDT